MPDGLVITQSSLTLTLSTSVFTGGRIPRRLEPTSIADLEYSNSGTDVVIQPSYTFYEFDVAFVATPEQLDILHDMFFLATLNRSNVIYTRISDYTITHREIDVGSAQRTVAPDSVETVENGLRKYYADYRCRWREEPEVSLDATGPAFYQVRIRLKEAIV